jgi:hypothetical protein
MSLKKECEKKSKKLVHFSCERKCFFTRVCLPLKVRPKDGVISSDGTKNCKRVHNLKMKCFFGVFNKKKIVPARGESRREANTEYASSTLLISSIRFLSLLISTEHKAEELNSFTSPEAIP